ncbi:MAG: glycosyltransferase family 4 protein [Actinobacteria bacterium]|nr:MAG: glycosyltransferase family 4 protein [Actinomycetota bacterium]RIK03604.1 MAG: glycosyltransferase family 4 protein [Acidobacteriota bacterium]
MSPQAGRALVLTSNYPRWPGDSTTPFVLALTAHLHSRGWLSHVLAPHAPGAARHEVLDGVPVSRFRYFWPESAETVCYGGGALVNLRKKPSNYFKLPALVAAELAATLRYAVKERVDLIHAHWSVPQGFVATTVARMLGLPSVVTVHGGDVFALGSGVITVFKRLALEKASIVTVNSSATEAAVRSISSRVTDLRRIPMGVDVNTRADPAVVRSIRAAHAAEGPLLVFVGRIVEEKGIFDLVEMMSVLRERQTDARLLLIGEGQDRPLVEERVARAGLGDRVRMTGWVEASVVPSYLAAADIVLAPSRPAPDGWIEAQGLSIIEAMAAAKPVIATRLGGIADSITDGETGVLVAPGEPAQLARAVESLLSDPEHGHRMGLRARATSVDKFSHEVVTDAFTRAYNDAVTAGRRLEGGAR